MAGGVFLSARDNRNVLLGLNFRILPPPSKKREREEREKKKREIKRKKKKRSSSARMPKVGGLLTCSYAFPTGQD